MRKIILIISMLCASLCLSAQIKQVSISKSDLVATSSCTYGVETHAINGYSDLQEYTIKAGKQNFKPFESFFPKRAEGFTVKAIIDSSCYYSQEDWALSYDRDWHDWNKLKGLSWYFNANNKDAAMVAWRPDTAAYTFQISPYVNDKKGGIKREGRGIIINANERFEVKVYINRRSVSYEFILQDTSYKFFYPYRRRLPKQYREIGTWIGGANNAEGPYGGKASKDMKLWAELRYHR